MNLNMDYKTAKITQKEAAEFFGVDRMTIRKTAALAGMNSPYNFAAFAKAYVDRLREAASGRDEPTPEKADLQQEQARLARAKADDQERKNLVAEGELLEAAQVEEAWTGIVMAVRSGVMALGSRLAPELVGLKNERQMKARIDKETHQVLTDLSQSDL